MTKHVWLTIAAAAILTTALTAQNSGPTEWRTYGGDNGHQRFSSLTQITPANVAELTKAWEFDTKVQGRKWQNTPVVIGGTMYITLQNGGVVALVPETGAEIWRFETPVRGRSVRSVSYWPGDAEFGARLLYGAGDKLWALDPATGKPIESFGTKGVADVHPGTPASMPRGGGGGGSDADPGPRRGSGGPPAGGAPQAGGPPPGAGGPGGAGRPGGGPGGPGGGPGGQGRGGPGGPGGGGAAFGSGFSISSPPVIYKNVAILGGSEGENAFVGPPGDPQAFDVRTGKKVWSFRVVPHPGDKNFGTWGDGWKDRGGPAIWGLMTLDAERGTIFIPTGNPGGSFYGGDRPGDNLYSVSIVALDVENGTYKWHYQTTRHDLYDADLAAAPTLIDVVQNGKTIPAVAQITKMGGMLFILDRLTGKPIHGVEDRKVPPSNVPGEKAAATQPFPVKPAPWARLGMTKADLTTVTPESNRFCTAWWEKEQMYNDGPYTPYGAKGTTVVFSGTIGGGNWGGVAFSPPLGYVFVNTSNLATLGRMVPDAQNPGKWRNELAYTRFWDDNKYPCQQPPWGELVAVNANTGDIAWKVPLGIYPELVAKGIPPTGTPNLGGPIATASGLVFIGATKDARFRAFDARSGKELWYGQLEGAGAATPMTYMGKDGTQYVVIAQGGPGDTDRGGTEQYPQKLVAFALSSRVKSATGGAAPAAAAAPAAGGVAASMLTGDALTRAKATTERVCTSCHGLDDAITGGRSAESWRKVVEEMSAMGAQATPEDFKLITDYLIQAYPAKR
jgi:glucose dehydrogenase